MAGHSKWSKIKRQKAVTDKAKGKLFSKLGREIAVAAREGGGDPDFNPRLRTAMSTRPSPLKSPGMSWAPSWQIMRSERCR